MYTHTLHYIYIYTHTHAYMHACIHTYIYDIMRTPTRNTQHTIEALEDIDLIVQFARIDFVENLPPHPHIRTSSTKYCMVPNQTQTLTHTHTHTHTQ